jgi:hypothetical protein
VTVVTAGTVGVKLKLTAAAQRLLRTKGKLGLKVRITFTPSGGTAITKTTSFTVRP